MERQALEHICERAGLDVYVYPGRSWYGFGVEEDLEMYTERLHI